MANPIVALIGNPNCGKSTLFNALTGARQHVGNWPGVTVEKKSGLWIHSQGTAEIIDLPGIYSLQSVTEDEAVAVDFLDNGCYDLVVNVLDSSSLARGLQLTLQILEKRVPVVTVLTMEDTAKRRGTSLDLQAFSLLLGVPALQISAVNKNDTQRFRDYLLPFLSKTPVVGLGTLPRPEAHNSADPYAADDARFEWIQSLLSKSQSQSSPRHTFSDKIDRFILGKWIGIPVFLVAMYGVFWMTINFGGAFIKFFDLFFGALFVDGLSELLTSWSLPAPLVAFLAQGIGSGVQTVSTFIPIIFMMFFMLSLLEDSGYMARAAYVMNRIMRLLGLPGKAFIPLLVGFGCTIPAIMATRTLESRRDRSMTIFMSPFMSCGARLPVYALFAAAFFGPQSGLIVFSLYMAGIGAALLTGLLLRFTLFKGKPTPLLMDLPAYHRPQFKTLVLHSWSRLKNFIGKAGITIVLIVTVLGGLNVIAWDDGFVYTDDPSTTLLASLGRAATPVLGPMGIKGENWETTVALFTGIFAKEAVIGTLSALLSGEQPLPEKEWNFWGAIGSAFQSIPDNLIPLGESLLDPLGLNSAQRDAQSELNKSRFFEALGSRFSPVSAYALILFVLLYFPCAAAFSTVTKELGLGLASLVGVYSTLLAWALSTLFYQLLEGHNILWILVPFGILGFIILGMVLLGYKKRTENGQITPIKS